MLFPSKSCKSTAAVSFLPFTAYGSILFKIVIIIDDTTKLSLQKETNKKGTQTVLKKVVPTYCQAAGHIYNAYPLKFGELIKKGSVPLTLAILHLVT